MSEWVLRAVRYCGEVVRFDLVDRAETHNEREAAYASLFGAEPVAEEDKEMFAYLDRLRESGFINMYGASKFIVQQYKVSPTFANDVLQRWMDSK